MDKAKRIVWTWVIAVGALLFWIAFTYPLVVSTTHHGHTGPSWVGFFIFASIPFLFSLYLIVSGLRKLRRRWLHVVLGMLVLTWVSSVVYDIQQERSDYIGNTRDMSNVKQLALGVLMYAYDWDGILPSADSWAQQVAPYVGREQAFHCPLDTSKSNSSYAMNARLSRKKLNAIKDPEKTILLFETAYPGDNPVGTAMTSLKPIPRHRSSRVVIATADARVRTLFLEKYTEHQLHW